MIEPLVCVPSATGASFAATTAADPLDDPPGVCAASCGFCVGPGTKSAYCEVTVLPMTIAPAARNLCTMTASRSGLRPAKISAPNSVGMSAVSMMSLTATGKPWSGPGAPPAARVVVDAFGRCKRASPDRDRRRREAWGQALRCDRETRALSRPRRVRPDACCRPASRRTGPEWGGPSTRSARTAPRRAGVRTAAGSPSSLPRCRE